MKNIALIFAGGRGQRMGSTSVPKQFLIVQSKPIIIHTIQVFQNNSSIDSIVVVCVSDFLEHMKDLVKQYHLSKIISVVPGGANGQESIYNGLVEINNKLSPEDDDVVLIHDGVRPLISDDIILKNINCARKNNCCITVTPATETILTLTEDTVDDVLERQECYYGRAPQSFIFKDIFECHNQSIKKGLLNFVDSSAMMSYFGYKLYTVTGPAENIKITTPMDYFLFKAILDARENTQNIDKL